MDVGIKFTSLLLLTLSLTLPATAAKRGRRAAAPSCQFEELKLDKALSRNPKTVFTSKSMSLVFMDGELLKKASAITDLGITKCEVGFENFRTAYYSAGQKKLVLQEKSGATKLMNVETCQVVEEYIFENRVPFEKCRIKKPTQQSENSSHKKKKNL